MPSEPSPVPDHRRQVRGQDPPDGYPSGRTPFTDRPAAEVPALTVAAAARRLGVAPATLRTWARRYGIGPSGHEAGRHRRYGSDDIARLELMQQALLRGASPAEAARWALEARLPDPAADRPRAVPAGGGRAVVRAGPDRVARVGDAVGVAGEDAGDPVLADTGGPGEAGSRVRVGGRVLRLPGASRRARGLGRAALALDAVAAQGIVTDAIATGGVQEAWEHVARPVLVAVADRWASTGAGVEIEHLLSQCVSAAFSAHTGSVAPRTEGRPVVLAGMPGEHHVLPMVVLGAALAEHGVVSRPLGADLPAVALVAALRRTTPAALVLWSQLPATADVALVRSLPRTRPRVRVLAAGPGWDDADLPASCPRLTGLAHAVEAIVAVAAL
jgi:MerR family transcriptional regulator, light-induced transcriptional regulator